MPSINIDRDLTRLETELRQLEAEYNMFFAGRLPKPPWETRARVEAIVKKLERRHLPQNRRRFPFTPLPSRFAPLLDLMARSPRAPVEGMAGPLPLERKPR